MAKSNDLSIKNVGIWIRVSTEDQARGDSPEHHEKRARMYAESRGWKVVEIYHLEALSGKSIMDYTETKRMMNDVKKCRISGLIFSKLARLARNTKELLDMSDYFQEHSADLISLQESIDTSTPVGRLFYTIIAAMAQWEREEIADRVAVSIPIRAKLGKPLGGKAPFGYQWVDGKLIPHPQQAPIRKLMYELFLEHHRKKTVAKLLNEKGYRTRSNTLFSDTTIERLIRDPTAKGLHRSNYTTNVDNKQCKIKPEEEWVYNQVEPIVSEDLWSQCNTIMNSIKQRRKPFSKRTVHLFSGLVFCHCGNKMYVPSGSPKYTCYKCRNKIPVTDLETVYFDEIKNYDLSPEQMSQFFQNADEKLSSKKQLLDTLYIKQKQLESEKDKVYRLYMDDKLSPEGFDERYRPLEEQSNQLNKQLPELQAEIDFISVNYLSSSQIMQEANDLYNRWQEMDQNEKRYIVENITEKITIGNNEISIDISYLHPPPKIVAKGQHINGAVLKQRLQMSQKLSCEESCRKNIGLSLMTC